MSKTEILFDNDAQQRLLIGINKVSQAVTVTLGPKGQNVLLSTVYGAPSIVHDGVSVAEKIDLEDHFENEGAKLIKEVASKTNEETGDGTTTATLLTAEMIKNGLKLVTSGANGMILRKGMESARDKVIEELKSKVTAVEQKDWVNVATISAQDAQIGKEIGHAFDLVGMDGSIQTEEGGRERVEIEHTEGMTFEKGYLSANFSTDFTKLEAAYNDALVLVTDMNISSPAQYKSIINAWMGDGSSTSTKPLLIICGGMSTSLSIISLQNKLQHGLPIVVVQAPDTGDRRSQILGDISVFTNAKFFSQELGDKLESITRADFGETSKIVVDDKMTTIISQSGKDIVPARVEEIKSLLENEENDFIKEFLKKRIAKLTKGVAVIYVAGKTDSETGELRERVKDAVGATRSAIEEGIVVGGGMALYNAQKRVFESREGEKPSVDRDFDLGFEIVLKACSQPAIKLIENCGQNSGAVLENIKYSKSENDGYNAYTGEIEDLMKSKVIDPYKVVRVALENSISTAGSFITTGAAIVDLPEKDKNE